VKKKDKKELQKFNQKPSSQINFAEIERISGLNNLKNIKSPDLDEDDEALDSDTDSLLLEDTPLEIRTRAQIVGSGLSDAQIRALLEDNNLTTPISDDIDLTDLPDSSPTTNKLTSTIEDTLK